MSASPARTNRRKGVVFGALVAVAALLLGWLSQYAVDSGGGGTSASSDEAPGAGDGSGTDAADREPVPELLALARRDKGDPLALGDAQAPVVLIEYADFGCSFCGDFARSTEPKLVEEYVDKGVLRIEWRNFPVGGEGSERAALAAWAAGKQGRFWQFHQAAYAKERQSADGFDDDRLTGLARRAGVPDLDRFERDRASAAARKALDRDLKEAQGLGAASTPSFLVNDQPVSGAQPVGVFREVIEQAAAAAKRG